MAKLYRTAFPLMSIRVADKYTIGGDPDAAVHVCFQLCNAWLYSEFLASG